ncbi:MAG: hypothetical protein JXR03_03060 [Cyclobacteriaceae bacterium]
MANESNIDTSDSGEKSVNKGFKKLLKNIGSAIEDAASLEVSTFTGEFNYKVNETIKNEVDRARVDQILKKMTLNGSVDLDLFAFTSIKIDSDVTSIVKPDINTETDKDLLAFHKEMLTESRAARKEIINTVKDLVGSLTKK